MTNASAPKWVVGVDGSNSAVRTATWAATHARSRGSTIELTSAWTVPVIPSGIASGAPVILAENFDVIEQAARDDLDRLATTIRAEVDVTVTTRLVHGAASAVLLEASGDASLLVVGSRGAGGFSRLLLGSTSTQCATHAEIPTVVVPHESHAEPIRRIIVGVDGSSTSLDAVRWAIDFAQPETVIECVAVWEAVAASFGADQIFDPGSPDAEWTALRSTLDELAATEAAAGLDIRSRVEIGSARRVLAAAAKEADLLVTGARGHGAIGSALLGSVSTWLLHHVDKPMVIVPDVPVESADTEASAG